MKKDIEKRDDIYLLVGEFYKKLLDDANMMHFFEKFKDDVYLEHHLQILVDFWDNVIFYSGTYQKNAMIPHLELNKTKPFKTIHFEKWLAHFEASVDENFEGENAHKAKTRALSIATIMKIKILSEEY